jgi:acyl carrier protein
MKGYFNRLKETSDIIRDGWLYTGDTGYVDDDGYLFVTGRKKDIIVSPTGKNINPEELEMAIKKQSKTIDEIGIFLDENVLHALIYPSRDNGSLPGNDDLKPFFQETVIAQYNQSVSPYKKISRVTIINEALPKTRVGKLRRFLFTDIAGRYNTPLHPVAAEHGKPSEKADSVSAIISHLSKTTATMSIHKLSKWLTEQIAEVRSLDVEDIDDQLPFVEMGLDSLDAVQITDHMENTFGIPLPKTLFWDYPTIADCCMHVHGLLQNPPTIKSEAHEAR